MSTKTELKNGSRTYFINGDYIKFHTVYKDGREIIEEYGLYSEELESRKVKNISMTGKEIWENEVGDDHRAKTNDDFLIKENENNPIFIRKDNVNEFQWRIRNLKGDADNFNVVLDKEKQQIVIKTKNKKYYKRFSIPDLVRLGINLEEKLLSVNFINSTLVISYKKPKEVIESEKEILEEIRKIRTDIKKNPDAKYDPQCKNQ